MLVKASGKLSDWGACPSCNCMMVTKIGDMEKTMKKQATSAKVKPRKHMKAATEDIVPRGATARPKINSKWTQYYRRLSELRDFFLRQKGMLTQDAMEEQPSYSEHMADAGTDSYDRDFALSMLSSDQNALYEIEDALRRIEAGTYGKCELTGKPIPQARLEAIPWARFTIEAEKQLERDGEVNRAQLAPLGSVAAAAKGKGEEEEAAEPHESTR